MPFDELAGAMREQRAAYLEIRDEDPNNLRQAIQGRTHGPSALPTIVRFTPVEVREEERGGRIVALVRKAAEVGAIDPYELLMGTTTIIESETYGSLPFL